MTLHNDKYLKIEFFADDKLLISTWSANLLELSLEEYKELLLKFAEFVTQHRPEKILMDTLKAAYPITPQLQEWLIRNIAVKEMQAGVKRVAYLQPLDFTSKLGIELTREKETAAGTGIVRMFFDDKDEALKWLNG